MSHLFADFPAVDKAEWIELLGKELKGASLDTLQKVNPIEEIAFPSYFHTDDALPALSDPGLVPYSRGVRNNSNDWNIGTPFRITTAKETNTEILAALNAGTSALVLHATSDNAIDFNSVLADVGLEYIHTSFYPQTLAQAEAFSSYIGGNPAQIVAKDNKILLHLSKELSQKALQPFAVNAYLVQQAGGTTWQELSIALAEGHELLVQQMDQGLTIDEAAGNIHFIFGIGATYFLEVSKFRSFRTMWAKIVERYNPQHNCSMASTVTAQTGFINYSVKDPYTNLLRQTTEALSAVIGGINNLVVQPYDWYTSEQNTPFTRRMATNISLLLKDEAYMDQVIDPAGGSYAIEALTRTVQERAWTEFQRIERIGGIEQEAIRSELNQEITEKRTMRIAAVKSKTVKRIGINVFPNPETVTNTWTNFPTAWNGLSALILELEA